MDRPILTVKQVAPLRQYQAAYAGGQAYVWKVMLGLMVGLGGLGRGVDREEQASEMTAVIVSVCWLPCSGVLTLLGPLFDIFG